MFEISWSELLILAIVILLFVKPKDLPYFFNRLGRLVGELKRQANEFRRQFEDAMREAEMENIRKELGDVQDQFQNTADEMGTLADRGRQELKTATSELQRNFSLPNSKVQQKDEGSFPASSSSSKGAKSGDIST